MAKLYKMTLYVCDLNGNMELDTIKREIEERALDGIAVSCLCHFAYEQVGPEIEFDDGLAINRVDSTTEDWEKYFDGR